MNTFTPPTAKDLSRISEKYGFECTDEDIKAYETVLKQSIESYRRVWNLPEAVPLVKYPRTPGYRPSPEENPLNAWYWKCDIKGSPAGKLVGKKVAIKDNVCVAGVPMMNGSRTLEGFIPEQDATVVTKLLDDGADIIGKTTVEDLCMSGASFMTTYGPVRNPWNHAHSAGGSSHGSAALVATGCADMAIGGDQGGSIRIPCSCCGIVGLKPTYGLVPYTGTIPIETTLDHVGPITRTIKDCALMLEVISGYDSGADPRQPSIGYPDAKLDFVQQLKEPTNNLRVGIVKEGFDVCEPDVTETVKQALEAMRSSGRFAQVEEVSIPMHSDPGHHIWAPIGFLGVTHQMIDGAGYGTGLSGLLSSRLSEKIRQGLQVNAHTLSHTAKFVVMFGAYTREKYGLSLYAKGQTMALELRRKYDEALKNFDVLVMPTLPQTPCKLPDKDTPVMEAIGRAFAPLANTCPFNFTHHPALTLNAGFSSKNQLPVGIMIVGRHWEDGVVLRVAQSTEEILAPFQTFKLDGDKVVRRFI